MAKRNPSKTTPQAVAPGHADRAQQLTIDPPRMSRWGAGPVMVIIVLAILSAASLEGWRRASAIAVVARKEAVISTSNTRRLLQQLHTLGTLNSDLMTTTDSLSPGQKQFLNTWVLCDEHFLRVNRTYGMLRFERAVVAKRAAAVRTLFGDTSRAIAHLDKSISLLEELDEEHLEQYSYALELIDCYGMLAWARTRHAEYSEAIEACVAASKILNQLQLPETPDSDAALVNAVVQVSEAALNLGEADLALEFAQAEVQARTRMSNRQPGNTEATERLREALDFLQKTRRGST